MDQQRIDELRAVLDAECISIGDLIEIQGEFEKIDPATLRDLPENAMAGDMLDEIEARLPEDEGILSERRVRRERGQEGWDGEGITDERDVANAEGNRIVNERKRAEQG